jgi:YD repeat-containing protein
VPLTQEQSCEAVSQSGVLGKHPIEYFSGQKVKSQLDYEDLGAFPLSVVRYYRSGVGAVGEPNASYNSADYGIVPIGAGWRLGFGGKLLPSGDTPVGRNTPSLTARLWDGTQIGFDGTAVLDGNGNPTAISYTPRISGQGSLSYQHSATQAERRWIFSLAGSADKWVFNSLGQLLEHRNAQGQTHTYSYTSVGNRLRGITDAFGRSMQLAYNGSNGQLQSILPPLNQLPITYSYDAQNRLSSVTYLSSPVCLYTCFLNKSGFSSCHFFQGINRAYTAQSPLGNVVIVGLAVIYQRCL